MHTTGSLIACSSIQAGFCNYTGMYRMLPITATPDWCTLCIVTARGVRDITPRCMVHAQHTMCLPGNMCKLFKPPLACPMACALWPGQLAAQHMERYFHSVLLQAARRKFSPGLEVPRSQALLTLKSCKLARQGSGHTHLRACPIPEAQSHL